MARSGLSVNRCAFLRSLCGEQRAQRIDIGLRRIERVSRRASNWLKTDAANG